MANVPISNLTTTWNASGTTFTGFKLNVTDTASAAGSLLADFQVGGVSRFSVRKDGEVFLPQSRGITFNSGNDSSRIYQPNNQTLLIQTANADRFEFSSQGLNIGSASTFRWKENSNLTGNVDLVLARDAANTLAQRNGVTAQTFRLYNTYTDASNLERAKFEWASNVLRIGTEKLGTGAARALEFQTDGTTRFSIAANGNISSGPLSGIGTWNFATNTTFNGVGMFTFSGWSVAAFESNLSIGFNATGKSLGLGGDTTFVINYPGTIGGRLAVNTNGDLQITRGQLWFGPTYQAPDAGFARTSDGLIQVNNGTLGTFRDLQVRKHFVDQTVTAGGVTGAQTINKAAGTVNFAAGGTTLVVTNSLVTTSSAIYCSVRTDDATAIIKNVVSSAGSFTITLNAAATTETSVGFLVIN